MKNKFHILSILIFSLLLSCVNEDDVFDEEFTEVSPVIQNSVIFSLFNENYIVQNNLSSQNNCFSFNYPIQIELNTGITIIIENEAGMQQLANSQSNNFFITGNVFPINAITNNLEVSVTDVNDLNDLFISCNITTLKETLIEKINTCFDFEYPIIIFDSNENEISTNNSSEFIDFIESQNTNYVPSFSFPFVVNNNETINNYFELYEVTNACETIDIECSEIILSSSEIDNNNYAFSIESNSTDITNIQWFINGELIEGETSTTFNNQFTQEGIYEVCSKAFTGCNDQQMTCASNIEIFIEDCSDLIYEYQQTTLTVFTFIVPENIRNKYFFLGLNVNGENEGQFANGNTQLTFDFEEEGTYEVCLFTETPECPFGAEYCELIIVDNIE